MLTMCAVMRFVYETNLKNASFRVKSLLFTEKLYDLVVIVSDNVHQWCHILKIENG